MTRSLLTSILFLAAIHAHAQFKRESFIGKWKGKYTADAVKGGRPNIPNGQPVMEVEFLKTGVMNATSTTRAETRKLSGTWKLDGKMIQMLITSRDGLTLPAGGHTLWRYRIVRADGKSLKFDITKPGQPQKLYLELRRK